ncbi:MAG: alcohol dehydrogenase zinc-binding protein [Marmoricola sp.]|nr:alcohol dehydrogenase zinc-binding protein [Marmoricola sp.]
MTSALPATSSSSRSTTSQVRIAVQARGVHLLDTSLRRGEAGPMPLPELPTVPGREVAGVVDRVGAGVDPTWAGERAVAHLGMVPGGWADRVRGGVGAVDLVYDGVGGAVGRSALELLKPGGRLVMFGFSAGSPTQFDTGDVVSRGLTVGWSLGPRMVALPGGIRGLAARSLDRLAAGEWSPLVSTYPLAEAARAHADLEGRRALGKVVLTVDR